MILSSSITTPRGVYTLPILSCSLCSYIVILVRTDNIMTVYAIYGALPRKSYSYVQYNIVVKSTDLEGRLPGVKSRLCLLLGCLVIKASYLTSPCLSFFICKTVPGGFTGIKEVIYMKRMLCRKCSISILYVQHYFMFCFPCSYCLIIHLHGFLYAYC